MDMTLGEFVERIKAAGGNDDSVLVFGYVAEGGDWYGFDIDNIEKEDDNIVAIDFEVEDSFKKSLIEDRLYDLENDLDYLISKYC